MKTVFPPNLDEAMRFLRLESTRPLVAKLIIDWFDDSMAPTLYEIKKSGSGKQAVFTYSAETYVAVLNMLYTAHAQKGVLSREEKRAYITVLMATGLFTSDNLAVLFDISRGSVNAWRVKRSPLFPVARIGGFVTADTIMTMLRWWKLMTTDHRKRDEATWLLVTALKNGDNLSVLARLSGQSSLTLSREMAKIHKKVDEGKAKVSDYSAAIVIDSAELPREAAANRAGHVPAGREDDSPAGPDVLPVPDDDDDSLIRPPVPVDDSNSDAFAATEYLTAVSEATDGDAGQSDADQDGVDEGSEDNPRYEQTSSGRQVHPAFLSQGD